MRDNINEAINKAINKAISKASLTKAALLSALFIAFYMFINNSDAGVAGLLKITGGASILDFKLGYSYAEACRMLSELGADGRHFYLTRILPLDFLFPFSYMLFFGGWIACLLKRAAREDALANWHVRLLAAPALAMLFDWTENAGIIAMLSRYPDAPAWAAYLASVAGILKMALFGYNIFIICFLAVRILIYKIRYY